MSENTMPDLFQTTNKGLLLSYTENTMLNQEFYNLSLALQIMFMLIFMSYFGMTIVRAYKKIKNPKFKIQSVEEQSSISDEEQSQDQQNEKDTKDRLVYRFDEEDHEKERKFEDEDDFEPEEQQKQESQNQKDSEDEEYDNEHDEHEDLFLEIDHKVMFLQPFLIGHIICNNIFASDIISLIMLGCTILLFLIFNVKGVCSKVTWFSLLFMIPGLISFLPFFLNDHDLGT